MRRHVKKLLSALPAGEYFGRNSEREAILRHADGFGGLRVASAPWTGASELLHQVFDRLFFEQTETIPFYFALRPSDTSASNAAVRFAQEFLFQAVAFRRRDPNLYLSAPEIGQLSQMAPAADAGWIKEIIDGSTVESRLNDENAFIRSCVGAPLRADSAGAKVFVVIDDLHNSLLFDTGDAFVRSIAEVYSRSRTPFVVAARRRMTVDNLRLPELAIDDLDQTRASDLTAHLARSFNVNINDQTRDLIAVQTNGKPGFIQAMISSAAAKGRSLDSFQNVATHYVSELIDGSLGGFYRDAIDTAAGGPGSAPTLIRLLRDAAASGTHSRLEAWREKLSIGEKDFEGLVRIIEYAEIADIDGGLIRADSGDLVLLDNVAVRLRIEAGTPKPVAAGEMIAAVLKRAPRLMTRLYRREASLRMAELVKAFDCQKVPVGLIDYRRFREAYKGQQQEKIVQGLLSETERITLPQIVHTAPAGEYYPPLNKLIDPERSTVARGFVERRYADDGETVWLVAEIDSKTEAARDVAEFWCDRLEMAAESCGLLNYKIWLIAMEGFSPEALDVLAGRHAFGSSRRQIEYLRDFLNAGDLIQQPSQDEYEMVIPVGEDTELIAAHAVEEIARRHNFPSRAINQIKTALVEACINAAEHGLSPDRKIYQRFAVDAEKIVITISNRGIRLADAGTANAALGARAVGVSSASGGDPFEIPAAQTTTSPHEGRRGWGLNLIRGLMDDVKIEAVDDGTRISMTKYRRAESAAA